MPTRARWKASVSMVGGVGGFAAVGGLGTLVHDAGEEFVGHGRAGLVGVEPLADEPAGDGNADDGRRQKAERRIDDPDGGAVGDAALFPESAEGVCLSGALRVAVGRDHADELAQAVAGDEVVEPDHRAADERLSREADGPDERLPHAAAYDILRGMLLITPRPGEQQRDVADVEGMEQEPVETGARDLPVPELEPARRDDGESDEAADDAGRHQIGLEQLDLGAQERADEQHQRKEAEEDEIFKTASHDKTPSLRLTRGRALWGVDLSWKLQALFQKKRILKNRGVGPQKTSQKCHLSVL